jgi:glycosyltransferase involved in cell wall biosynthesis
MSAPLRVLIVTDSFPPNCGGSGWSTWELTRGLGVRGHDVRVVHVEIGRPAGVFTRTYESQPVTTFRVDVPNVPFVRNRLKNERLWVRLGDHLIRSIRERPVDVIHAQHVMTTVPSIRAGTAAGVPVVATVRDYWPVCYWSDLIYDPSQPQLCPACSARMMLRCVRPRAGLATPAAWPLIPYMRANLRTKRTTLASARAVIAVSSAIARDLRQRAPELAGTEIVTIPNPIDMAALDAAYDAAEPPLAGPYVLYAGKLAINKGVQFLVPAMTRAGLRWPLVVVGDGPWRGALERDARAAGVDLRVMGWRGRDDVWAWMRHAAVLAFPSYGPESLSRVLIEGAALGAPVAAMDTGGTRDIVTPRVTGLLSSDVDGFARDLAELARDRTLAASLGAAARADVHDRFAATAVVAHIEQVYRQLIDASAGAA